MIREPTKADYDAAARLNGYGSWNVYECVPHHNRDWMELCAHDFAKFREQVLADAALKGE